MQQQLLVNQHGLRTRAILQPHLHGLQDGHHRVGMGSPLRAGPSSSYLVLVTILHFLHTILPTFSPPHVISSPIAAPSQSCPCHLSVLDPSFPVQATYSSSSYQLFNTGTSVLQQFEHRMKDYLQDQLAKASLLQLPLPIGSTPATTASGPAATPLQHHLLTSTLPVKAKAALPEHPTPRLSNRSPHRPPQTTWQRSTNRPIFRKRSPYIYIPFSPQTRRKK